MKNTGRIKYEYSPKGFIHDSLFGLDGYKTRLCVFATKRIMEEKLMPTYPKLRAHGKRQRKRIANGITTNKPRLFGGLASIIASWMGTKKERKVQ